MKLPSVSILCLFELSALCTGFMAVPIRAIILLLFLHQHFLLWLLKLSIIQLHHSVVHAVDCIYIYLLACINLHTGT